MVDELENFRRPATLGELETRVAELEARLGELTTHVKSTGDKSARADERSITEQATRLAKLEERHENLLRHTPQAREEANPVDYILGFIAVIVALYFLAYYIFVK